MTPYDKIIKRFQVPPEGEAVLEQILDDTDRLILSKWEAGNLFTTQQLNAFFICHHAAKNTREAEAITSRLFSRGILDKAEAFDSYRFGCFYGRLDIFATEEAQAWRELPDTTRELLDEWYFQTYLRELGSDLYPTEDTVYPLSDILSYIDQKEEQAYLALCDCRMLKGGCQKSTKTCITYRTAPNSYVKRGHAVPITKEEARQVVLSCDKEGLIHTANPGGICNCCTDCCYLFRAAKARRSHGIWPKTNYLVELDAKNCVGCGVCIKRCRFQALTLIKAEEPTGQGMRVVLSHPENCIGCGLCATGCKTKALSLTKTGAKKHEYHSGI